MENILNNNPKIFRREEVPTVMVRKNMSEPKNINPYLNFNGFFLHQPLDTATLFNKTNKIRTSNLFISKYSTNTDYYYLTQDSSLITVSVPWSWLEEILGNFNIYFPFNKIEDQIYLTEDNEIKSKIMELSILYFNRDIVENSQNKEMLFMENLGFLLSLLEVIKTVIGKYATLEKNSNQEKIQIKELQDIDPLQEMYEQYICNPLIDLPKTEEMAKSLRMSASTFKTKFKQRYKCSYIQAHMNVKMNYAMQMLLNGFKVNDVSAKIGYTQPTKFIIVFKKFFRTTPGNVKKNVSFNSKCHSRKSKFPFESHENEKSIEGVNDFFTQNEIPKLMSKV